MDEKNLMYFFKILLKLPKTLRKNNADLDETFWSKRDLSKHFTQLSALRIRRKEFFILSQTKTASENRLRRTLGNGLYFRS